ncbi:MAG: transcription antitermination factor NusB [Gammaproteobacteria bacterium]|nr:MAG: transcription antitermination factor NusB [Gammaproteobacteria bacterium]
MSPRGRHAARRLLLQALYQNQIAGHDSVELRRQFDDSDEFSTADSAYFHLLLDEILDDTDVLDQHIDALADRPVAQIDPVERAILWIGMAELGAHPDVPVKVVINEAVEIAKEFGAQDSYRYINAILDKASGELR